MSTINIAYLTFFGNIFPFYGYSVIDLANVMEYIKLKINYWRSVIMGLELIGKLKHEQGLTSDELAIKAGVPLGTLNKILNGETKNPTFETVLALAHALGRLADDFDDDDDDFDAIKKDNPYSELPESVKSLIFKWSELTEENRLKIMGMIDIKLVEQKE
jgi:transcriptional regulator with XRE-family HTH domain